MIWPIKPETLRADSTERLDTLALPKVNFMKGDKINRYLTEMNVNYVPVYTKSIESQ